MITAFAEEVCVSGACLAAVITASAEEVCAPVIWAVTNTMVCRIVSAATQIASHTPLQMLFATAVAQITETQPFSANSIGVAAVPCHICRTRFLVRLIWLSCLTLLRGTFVGHSYLTRFVGRFQLTKFIRLSYLALVWDTLT